MSNFLLGGRLGDAVHALYVCKNTPGKHKIYITDKRHLHSDGFLYDLTKTYEELKPIMEVQDYCDSFEIFNNQFAPLFPSESYTALLEPGINLSAWRRYAYSASWTKLLSNTFGVPVNGESWISVDKSWPFIEDWKERIVIHRSMQEARKGHNWELVMNKYEGQCIFVGRDDEYHNFGYNIPNYAPTDLSEYFNIINSCKFFIGNQSMPLAIAHSLGTPRLAMLNEGDKIHYVGEEKYHKNYYWISQHEHFFEGLNY